MTPSPPTRRPSLPSSVSQTTLSKRSVILPLSILIGIVLASTAQTESANYLSTTLRYDKTYFTFYITHSTFSLVFPIHLFVLYLTTGVSPRVYLRSITQLIARQLGFGAPQQPQSQSIWTWRELAISWSKKVGLLTTLISVPALSWFVAMSLSSPMDITAIYASSSFSAYAFSMIFLHTPLSRVTLLSIAIAFVGVLVVSLDGVGEGGEAGRRILGDCIMLFGAIILGLYEVVYKLALPEEHGGVAHISPAYTPLPTSTAQSPPTSPKVHHRPYHPHRGSSELPIPLDEAGPPMPKSQIENIHPLDRTTSSTALLHPPFIHKHNSEVFDTIALPPALHANFLTSCIGLATFVFMWPPIIWLHWTGYEVFQWPDSWQIWVGLEVVAWGGSLYNAGLMALIGIWGPTISSVANLLTIGVVAIIDSLWTGTLPDMQTVLGVSMICLGFGVLLWEGEE